jgi:hypothetical protein
MAQQVSALLRRVGRHLATLSRYGEKVIVLNHSREPISFRHWLIRGRRASPALKMMYN